MSILQSIKAALAGEPRLAGRLTIDNIEIDDDGVATLAGAADSIVQKKLALERTAALSGVSAIVDRLHVLPASPMTDAEISEHLGNHLIDDPSFRGLRVERHQGVRVEVLQAPDSSDGQILYEVDDGIVTLNGNVPSLSSKRLAGVLAWWVPGSRDVINGIAVEPPEQDAPVQLEEAVRIVLEKDPFVDATQIRVGVRHHVVHLTGAVTSEGARVMAERDAWYVLGVDDVINDIVVTA